MKKINSIHFLLLPIGLDIIFIFLHLAYWKTVPILNLDIEMAVPTAYQGAKLLILGTLSLVVAVLISRYKFADKSTVRRIWLPLFILFTYLGIDELMGIHEELHTMLRLYFPVAADAYFGFWNRVGLQGEGWIHIFLPLIIGFAVYCLASVNYLRVRFSSSRLSLLMIGFLMLFSIPLLEKIAFDFLFADWDAFVTFATIEEGFEMIGVSLVLIFVSLAFRDLLRQLRYVGIEE